jgi:hypothetical protein
MDINRRVVVQGIVLTGIAELATPAWSATFTADASPLFLLVNDDRAGRMFVRGAAQAQRTLETITVSTDLQPLLDLDRLFRRSVDNRIIGLLDDASGTLAIDLARSAGARIKWLGHHAAQGDFSRHQVCGVQGAEACVQYFGERLVACGDAFELSTGSQHICQPCPAAHSASWVSMLGRTLASPHSSHCSEFPDPASTAPMNGRFVSFSIEA